MTRWRWLVMADPVHGILQFDRKDPVHRLMLDTVNSRAFQRLRRVKQMGLAEFVFPGAVHSRFNHSLGAAWLMIQAINHFNHDRWSRELLESPFLAADGTDFGMSHKCVLMMGILLHDIGHPPLSHTLEDVLDLDKNGLGHDNHWFYKILAEDPGLQSVWQKHEVPNLPEALVAFMGLPNPKQAGPPAKKHFLATLVSSQLDMDRLDYLLRDSHFLGVKYGQIESDRIISCLEISNKHHGQPVVTILEDAMPALEHYLFGRHQAYKMALHTLDKASEALFKLTLLRFVYAVENGLETGHPAKELYTLIKKGETLSTAKYLRMDDCYLWEAIQCWSLESEDPLLKALAGRMMSHDLLKFVDLLQFNQPITANMQAELKAELETHYQERGLIFEYGFEETLVRPKPMYMPAPLREPIWVATRDKGVQELPEVSSLALTVAPVLMASSAFGGGTTKGHKHLWFVWDREARQFLRAQIQKRLG